MEERTMVQLVSIQGRPDEVFDAIKDICQRHPYMTLVEAGQKGLSEPKLQNTVPYELEKFLEVRLDSGIEDN
jgi:hypothetical protein